MMGLGNRLSGIIGDRTRKKEHAGLNIIIVGCGKIGTTLAEQLSKEGHDITIIDKNPDRITTLIEGCDVMGIIGNGASYSILQEAGIDSADLIIAVTNSDELNLLTCTIAQRVGQNCAAIARVRDPEYSDELVYLQQRLGLAMIINPEHLAAREIRRILSLPDALGVNEFAHGLANMVRFKVNKGSVLVGKSLMQVGQTITSNVLVCGAERGSELFIPDGRFVINEGDILTIIASAYSATTFLDYVCGQKRRARTCMIIGGGKATYYLAKELESVDIEVKIIEQVKSRCEELSLLLPKAIIINGDGSQVSLLIEEGIEEEDAFVALTGMDEENILMTLYAKEVSNAKVITKLNRISYNDVLSNLDLGSMVFPKFMASESILRYVRAYTASKEINNIETLYNLFDHRAEAIEFKIGAASNVTGIPLKDLKLKDNLLITLIDRKGQILIPRGNDELREGDSVVIVTTHKGFRNLSDILQ